ncbi:P-loop containing nucleoside triphosphate hydrolase protein [Trichoderma evansii]
MISHFPLKWNPLLLNQRLLYLFKQPFSVFGHCGSVRFFTSNSGLYQQLEKKFVFTPMLWYQHVRDPERENSCRLYKYLNCKTFTFHGLATSLSGDTIYNDAIFAKYIRRVQLHNKLPKWKDDPFDIIVLDEFQDCTKNIFWLTNCFIRANNQKLARLGRPAARLVGADQRYLTLADHLLSPASPYPFAKIPLSQSFRLSNPSVQFINNAFLGGKPYITSSKSGPKPIILRSYPYHVNTLSKEIFSLIKTYGAKNSAILSPSIRNNMPFVSNIHQFKGCERDLVILFGIDASYFKYFGRDIPDDRCPNEIFNEKPMPFVSVDDLYKTADVVNLTEKQTTIAAPDAPGPPLQRGLNLPKSIGVRDLTRHIPDEPLDQILRHYLEVKRLSPPLPKDEHIDIDDIVLSNPAERFYEAVGDINGLVVTSAFEHHVTGTLSILKGHKNLIDGIHTMTQKQYISWLCRTACKYEADSSGYRPRFIQMKDHAFDWMKPEHLAMAQSRLQQEFGDLAPNLRFEVEAEHHFKIDGQEMRLRGQADIVSFSAEKKIDSIWEIKFVPRIMLFNLRDGEKVEMAPYDWREALRRMIESMTDEEFTEMCAKATLQVSNLRDSDE